MKLLDKKNVIIEKMEKVYNIDLLICALGEKSNRKSQRSQGMRLCNFLCLGLFPLPIMNA